MAEIRQFAAIFGVFPRFSEFYREKKRPRHAKSVLGASGRASHHAKSDTWKERLFGNNYVAQKVMGRSIGRSLKKLRYTQNIEGGAAKGPHLFAFFYLFHTF